METMNVTSSAGIVKVEYDKKKLEMYVTFKTGKVYTYYDVPIEIWTAWTTAESKGSFFSRQIKGRYLGTKAV